MLNITFDVKARVQIPKADEPRLQSLYVFNMYRAGSSIMEAIAQTLAFGSTHTSLNLVQKLDAAGVGIIDHTDYTRHSVHLDDGSLTLDTLGNLGGYIYYGFREIPRPYAERFIFTAASVIVARDPRDIAISQYAAVKKHVVSGASGEDIVRLRELTSSKSLEDFLLSDSTLFFIRRITNCYAPLIRRGCKLLRYEEFMVDGRFSMEELLKAVIDAFGSYIFLEKPMNVVMANLKQRVENSRSLKGHATGGQVNLYRSLDDDVLDKLNQALKPELMLYGYL